jgi:endonuclease/exonuclease/phosphatase family metal-dependent hydrolase
MKIISWNILAIEFVKKSYYPYIDIELINDRRQRIKQISALLQKENPDIIMLQEVMPYEYKYLTSKLEPQYAATELCKIDWSYYKDSESGNVTIYKKSVFAFDSVDKLVYNSNVFGQRTGLQIKKTNTLLHVFNVHLNDEYGQTRNAQINSIRSLLSTAKYCVLGGDFNQEYNAKSKLFRIPNFDVQNHNITYYEDNMNIDNILTKGFQMVSIDKNIISILQQNTLQQNTFKKIGSDHIPVIIITQILR